MLAHSLHCVVFILRTLGSSFNVTVAFNRGRIHLSQHAVSRHENNLALCNLDNKSERLEMNIDETAMIDDAIDTNT